MAINVNLDILDASAQAIATGGELNAKASPIIHTSRDGIKFWVEYDSRRILTDKPQTYLEEVQFGSVAATWFRLVLHLDGHPIEFAGPDDMPYEFRREDNPVPLP